MHWFAGNRLGGTRGVWEDRSGQSVCDIQPDVPHYHGVLGKGINPQVGEADTQDNPALADYMGPWGIQ